MIRRSISFRRSRLPFAIGAVALLAVSCGLLYLIISGKLRVEKSMPVATAEATSTPQTLLARRLDGVFVPKGEEALPVVGVLIENQADARPLSGLAAARVVFEAPVEGGITRFLALFDATGTASEIGPVRSARPYFVDWAGGFHAAFFHVGGSPEALKALLTNAQVLDVNEMKEGRFFWRSAARAMPHNTYVSRESIQSALNEKTSSSTPLTAPLAWHFQDASTSTPRGGFSTIRIPFGGAYSVSWKFDAERNVYQRFQAGAAQKDRDDSVIEAENVAVIKTDAQVLDTIGRLKLRTTGSGDAMFYRDGNKYALRWRRAAGEPIRFVSTDGTEFLFNRGRVWIEVTTDDRMFAGLEAK